MSSPVEDSTTPTIFESGCRAVLRNLASNPKVIAWLFAVAGRSLLAALPVALPAGASLAQSLDALPEQAAQSMPDQTDQPAQTVPIEQKPMGDFQMPNLKVPTLGGKQFWTDHLGRQGWRIQRNAISGHWRLLNPDNVRHAWGNRGACQAALERVTADNTLPTTHAVILLHGLMRSSGSMRSLGDSLAAEGDYSVIYFEYASTRSAIADHAQALREVLAGLPENVELSFVGHSMGNIVVRHLIGDMIRAEDQQTLDRIQHVVMLGPPNQGSSIARQLAKTGVFGWVTGQGGMELGTGWQEFEARLAVPPCPFGIIAGRLPETRLVNPLVDGAGDFVVSVEETRLAGAADFLEVPRMHSFLMDAPTVHEAVASFLRHEHF